MNLKQRAAANLAAFARNPYPGRVIIIGLDETGDNLFQLYALTGRSDNSRNRIFVEGENGLLSTEPADPSKGGDPSLVIYNAMREAPHPHLNCNVHIVSNGHQTDAVVDSYATKCGFRDAMRNQDHEPDSPNFTSRITAISGWFLGEPVGTMSIIRKSPWSNKDDRIFHEMNDFGKGFGHCITTYSGNGSPLPAFHGEPILFPFLGDAQWVAAMYWEMLDPDNRISLAVKTIPKDGYGTSSIVIINKYQKV